MEGFQIFVEIWAPKSSKYSQILTFCPLFELQKAVLGDLIFEGSNQLQIQKFRLGWKVDFQTFPMSYPASDLVEQNLPVFDQFGQLSTVFTWIDHLGM